jgi:outer membrane protein OmpA-like peptidoglycan-associated protein
MKMRLVITASLFALLAASPALAQEELSDECIAAGYSTADECYGATEPAYDEEPADEEPEAEEPVYEEPAYEEPAYEEPVQDEPEEVFEEPAAEEPVYDEPEAIEDEPVYEEPAVADEPVYEEEVTPDEPVLVEDEAVSEDEPVVDDDAAVEEEQSDESALPAADEGIDEAVFDDADAESTGLIDDSIDDAPYVEVIETDDPLVGLPPEDLSDASEPLDGVAADEAAPLLDSAKEGDVTADDGEDVVVPDDDEAAQVASLLSADEIVAAAPPETKVLDAAPALVTPQNVTIINNVENTYIYQVNNQTIINNYYDDRDRIFNHNDDYWYDQIGPNRYRESVYRNDGSTVVTIRDQYGNILERYVVNDDGSSYVLAYFEPDYYDDLDFWGDAGYGLPALRLTISLRDYVLDWRYADASAISVFLRYPPVETARRVYSIDEVKRSARLRDSVRRLEVTDLNFASGSAELSRNQARSLERLASAIKTLLRDNPGETFLIEGHTDAVGSDQTNLLLSDKRASSVARILTQYYGVPPENLATQGYGARYLRVNTQRAEPQNRRVTVRRITPLVQPYFAGR